MSGKRVRIDINGEAFEGEVEPRLLLVHFLRDYLKLTGTHIGCETGNCGACTILVDGAIAKSCTMFTVQADGAKIVTIEGLSKDGKLNAVQQAFHENHALQCGYCTPGFIVTVSWLLKNNLVSNDEDIRSGIAGNICRCTGYVNIVKAIRSLVGKQKLDLGW